MECGQGKRYRLRMRNASDDIRRVHLHRHSFELTRIAGKPTSSRPHPVPLPSAAAHGFWLHGAVR
jgi:hypothetical protein